MHCLHAVVRVCDLATAEILVHLATLACVAGRWTFYVSFMLCFHRSQVRPDRLISFALPSISSKYKLPWTSGCHSTSTIKPRVDLRWPQTSIFCSQNCRLDRRWPQATPDAHCYAFWGQSQIRKFPLSRGWSSSVETIHYLGNQDLAHLMVCHWTV